MRPYEVMVIFDTGAEPPAIQAVVDRLLETVRANEGTPGQVDRWGRRGFAYEVNHRREGYYVLVEFSGAAKTVTELDRFLALSDEVLRHKVIRLPEKAGARAASASAAAAGRGAAIRSEGESRGSSRPSAGAGRSARQVATPPTAPVSDPASDSTEEEPTAAEPTAAEPTAAEPTAAEPMEPETDVVPERAP